jgi:hypothetical protein
MATVVSDVGVCGKTEVDDLTGEQAGATAFVEAGNCDSRSGTNTGGRVIHRRGA